MVEKTSNENGDIEDGLKIGLPHELSYYMFFEY